MSDIVCITNRKLCREDFLMRVEAIAQAKPKAIVLREKDLSKEEYKELAKEVLKRTEKYQTTCILHNFTDTALELNAKALHLPLAVLRTVSEEIKDKFSILGTSCHSLEEVNEAENLGCTYVLAGHIYETDCKRGLPGRGIKFLQNICENTSLPVYAIGGISAENIADIRRSKAAGACVMSGIMTCKDVSRYLSEMEG